MTELLIGFFGTVSWRKFSVPHFSFPPLSLSIRLVSSHYFFSEKTKLLISVITIYPYFKEVKYCYA